VNEQPLFELPIEVIGFYAVLFKIMGLAQQLHISAIFFGFVFMSFLWLIEHELTCKPYKRF
jgi:hypothetical protein